MCASWQATVGRELSQISCTYYWNVSRTNEIVRVKNYIALSLRELCISTEVFQMFEHCCMCMKTTQELTQAQKIWLGSPRLFSHDNKQHTIDVPDERVGVSEHNSRSDEWHTIVFVNLLNWQWQNCFESVHSLFCCPNNKFCSKACVVQQRICTCFQVCNNTTQCLVDHQHDWINYWWLMNTGPC